MFNRYLVDVKWMKQWKKYVGYDQWDQKSVGQESANPGPLDNVFLFRSEILEFKIVNSFNTITVQMEQ